MADQPRTYANAICPYCSVALDPLPRAKKKCPGCGQPIYVRLGPDGVTYLLRDADRHVLDEAWSEHDERQAYIKKTLAFGIDFERLGDAKP
jgi:hypothetical protein